MIVSYRNSVTVSLSHTTCEHAGLETYSYHRSHGTQVAAVMRRRLRRDKLIGSGTIHIPSAIVRNRGLQTVQLVDEGGSLAGQVQPCGRCTVC